MLHIYLSLQITHPCCAYMRNKNCSVRKTNERIFFPVWSIGKNDFLMCVMHLYVWMMVIRVKFYFIFFEELVVVDVKGNCCRMLKKCTYSQNIHESHYRAFWCDTKNFVLLCLSFWVWEYFFIYFRWRAFWFSSLL